MKRRQIVRLQIVVLGMLTVLVLARAFGGEGRPNGVIAFSDIGVSRLHEGAFRLEETSRIHVTSSGSIESRSDTSLAAYAWILDHSTREPVWIMSHAHSSRGSGMLVHVDTVLALDEGIYEAYFTSYGNDISSRSSRSFFSRIFDESLHWVNDAGNWSLIINPVDGSEGSVTAVSIEELREDAPKPFWTSGPMMNRRTAEELFDVRSPVDVHLYSIGEVTDRIYDYGWIRRAPANDTVWSLSDENATWAGGSDVNRRYRGTMTLESGIHSVGFSTDPGHAFDGWRANPPFDPQAWGLRLDLVNPADTSRITRFDPWIERRPAISLAPVGNDEHRVATIRVDEPAPVIIYSVGEIGRSRYDYGTLRASDTDTLVWEMTAEGSTQAGGHQNNRRQISFLTLQPGEYQLEYRTDGSHAYDDWRNGEPDHPDRWGVTLFTLDGRALGNVEYGDAGEPAAAPAPPAPPESVASDGPVLVALTRVGNEQRRTQRFDIDRTTEIDVHALGEITLSNRYDYAWIENVETGQTVWEMTYSNTEPAGGHRRNRMFDGVITFEPGRYLVQYQTDFSHAYGDFRSGEAPSEPEQWGITLRRP